jgi:hypothetical protein
MENDPPLAYFRRKKRWGTAPAQILAKNAHPMLRELERRAHHTQSLSPNPPKVEYI